MSVMSLKLDQKSALFNNHISRCIGTGRIGLALHKEYLEQLKYVQENIGFDYIRGHGLFAKDVGIYHEYKNDDGQINVEYNFHYLDQIMDAYQEIHIKPFLELGFMPDQLASGSQTMFFWKGNVTPPNNEQRWTALIQATLRHLLDRYGEDVLSWPIEVWNEPNDKNFWKDADMNAYFDLFKITVNCIKQVNPAFRVGGPAISGINDVKWFNEFIAFCDTENIQIDFFTRHMYTVNPVPIEGHYRYPSLRKPEEPLKELEISRKIINNSKFSDLPMYITEFNTSYSPDAPLHDTVKNAAYTASLLAKLPETSELYSYWTFGDVFEEKGIPFTQFYGGFGLLANRSIPKPTFWTFKFFNQLTGKALNNSSNSVITQDADGTIHGVLWNYSVEDKRETKNIRLVIPSNCKLPALLLTRTIDAQHGNPLKLWHDLGEPATLNKREIDLLRQTAIPQTRSEIITSADISFELDINTIIYFEVKTTTIHPDRGYQYEKVSD